ncbi:dystonin isoform X4 [Amia ocellicauda]|uniref:dystonin isoform X4 n=1 Tax=Amia ocellicauda TaxID=2972642 RepID=UPI0034644A0C
MAGYTTSTPVAYLYADERDYLQAYEDVLERYKDERDRVQKKTFTKWINQHLLKVRKHVNDLYEDLRDGHNLISLLEVLSGESLPREKGRMRFHRLQNVQIALDYLKKRQVKLVNIRNDDITDGNPKLTLGLIWTIILHFQISDIHVTGESEDMSAKEKLLLWSQQMTEGYVGVRCDNFTTSWRDGRLFNAIIHKYRPDLVDMNRVSTQTSRSNLEQAFSVAEKLGVARLLDPEDVDVQSPDEKSVITYVSTLYDVFPKVPEGGEGINANDVDIKWVEYQNMVKYLIQWIKHHVTIMSDRMFPNNPVELKALYNQYLQFKESEIPPKENEKTKIKQLYKMLEVWIEFGRIKLPQGYHPNDVEKEWGKLIIAMLEREKSLRPEVDRLEMLQQIANRVQRDCVAGEDKLMLARNALQSDAKRLESGIQFQNEAEIAGYFVECENLLRQQVVDIQILLDGKYYLADQLVQRVSKIRDDLFTLKSECSSVYSKGRTLTTEQTKMMISGITQSLNSGFSQNLNPSLNAGLSQGLTPSGLMPGMSPGLPTFTSSYTPSLTPSLTPAMTPGHQPVIVQSYMGGMDSGALQQLKLMNIRKPLMKSSLADSNLTEEEVNMNFVQDLLNWVDEMQVQLDRAEWGSDLPSVETHLENHKSVQRAIEEFQMSLKEAKLSEIQMNPPQKISYSEKLSKLESQYGKLLNTSRNRQKYLESLQDFVSRATQELIWLNEKEEEEVAYDWSDRNSNMAKKRDYHADLMRELDEKEAAIKSVQEMAEHLLLENHPARLTIEAYRAAMQTQWSWILQLCGCVEQHLKENAVYFEFFNDAKECMDYLKSLQDTIQRKYGCDRSSSLHKLEDLVQESMDEKEQLLQYRSTVAGLVGRAKSIAQLKPRNPEIPLRTSIPVKAICDYRQIEITIYKEDECVLANNSHRAKWKVISPTGNEAMVPSVCFTVPPPNKEAIEMSSRIEQLYQNVLTLWHRSHVNMKSIVSWRYMMNDIEAIRNGNVASIKTMLPGEHQQVLSNLQSHFEDFLEDSQESEVFTVADRTQLEREVDTCKEYYEELLKSAEREEQEESVYNQFISEVRNFRMRLEGCEERLIRQIRTPLERDDLQESILRISEQEKSNKELDRLKEDLGTMKEKCEMFISQASSSLSVPTLSSELNVLIQNMNQVHSMSSIYLEKLKTVSLVVQHSQGAETLVKQYEAKLCEEDAVNADTKAIETVMSTLKQWRAEIDEKREVFHDLEDELQKARSITDRMFKTHNERDFDLDWHKEKAEQLAERWQNVHSQIESRLRDLEGICKSLKYYRDTYTALDDWIKETEETQLKMQENQPEDSKALAELLNQQKVLVSEIELKQGKIDECQKYSEQYSAAVKDYELQLMTYRAMVDSQQKSPVKRRRMQSSSDVVIQEFMDLRTRYTALVTLMTQYVKFASETLKRTEEEEKSIKDEKKEHGEKVSKLLNWVSNVKTSVSKEDKVLQDGKSDTKETSSKTQVSTEEVAAKKEQIAEALRTTQIILAKHSDKMSEDERQETKEQLKSLQQAYNDLSQQSLDQLQAQQSLPAEQDFQTIEGILELESGAVFSVCRSVQKGLIDHTTGIRLLEAQLITSGLILPELSMCLDLDDAFKHGLVDEQTYLQLQELNKAHRRILNTRYASEPIPVVAAFKGGVISEQLAIKMIEIQLATGGLRVTYTGDVLNLEKAFQNGLIPPPLFVKILERQNTWKDLIDPNTAEKVSLVQLVQRSLTYEDMGMRLLPVKKGKDGKIALKSGREISVLRAVHEGLIDRETMFRLLGAQLFAGGIVDPNTNRKLSVEEALKEGLIDNDTACGILCCQAQNGGIVNPHTCERLTLDEAVQCNLITSSSALLVLERQKGFMGLLWPHSGEILTVSTSLQHEVITNQLAYKLLNNRQKIAAFYIPESSEVVGIETATSAGLIDKNTADVLKSTEIPDVFPDIEDLNDKMSTWLSLRELQIEGCHEPSSDLEISELDKMSPSPAEAQQLFISYIMMNSYMDPKSGQRLLIYDGQLGKMTRIFTENIEESNREPDQNIPADAVFSHSNVLSETQNTVQDHSDDKHSLDTYDNHADIKQNVHITTLSTADIGSDSEGDICIADDGNEENYNADDTANVTNSHTSGARFVSEFTRPDSQVEGEERLHIEEHHLTINIDPIHSEVQSPDETVVEGSGVPSKEILNISDITETGLRKELSIAALEEGREVSYHAVTSSFPSEIASANINNRTRTPDDFEFPKQMTELTETAELTGKLNTDVESTGEQFLSERARPDTLERENAVQLLRAQVEEGGILDVTSGNRYDINAALEKGLVDEEIAVDVLALQFQNGGIVDAQTGTKITLREAVGSSLITRHIALQVMEKLHILSGFYDVNTGKTISISEAVQRGLINEDVAENIINSEMVVDAIIGPERGAVHSIPEGLRLGLLDDDTNRKLLDGQAISGGIVGYKEENGKTELERIDEQVTEHPSHTEGDSVEKNVHESEKMKGTSLQMEGSGVVDPQLKELFHLPEILSKECTDKQSNLSVLSTQLEEGGMIQNSTELHLSIENILRHSQIDDDFLDERCQAEKPEFHEVDSNSVSLSVSEKQTTLSRNETLQHSIELESDKGYSGSVIHPNGIVNQGESDMSCTSRGDTLTEENKTDSFKEADSNDSTFTNWSLESEQKPDTPSVCDSLSLSDELVPGGKSPEHQADALPLQTSSSFSLAEDVTFEQESVRDTVEGMGDCGSDLSITVPKEHILKDVESHNVNNPPGIAKDDPGTGLRPEQVTHLLKGAGPFQGIPEQCCGTSSENEVLTEHILKDVVSHNVNDLPGISKDDPGTGLRPEQVTHLLEGAGPFQGIPEQCCGTSSENEVLTEHILKDVVSHNVNDLPGISKDDPGTGLRPEQVTHLLEGAGPFQGIPEQCCGTSSENEVLTEHILKDVVSHNVNDLPGISKDDPGTGLRPEQVTHLLEGAGPFQGIPEQCCGTSSENEVLTEHILKDVVSHNVNDLPGISKDDPGTGLRPEQVTHLLEGAGPFQGIPEQCCGTSSENEVLTEHILKDVVSHNVNDLPGISKDDPGTGLRPEQVTHLLEGAGPFQGIPEQCCGTSSENEVLTEHILKDVVSHNVNDLPGISKDDPGTGLRSELDTHLLEGAGPFQGIPEQCCGTSSENEVSLSVRDQHSRDSFDGSSASDSRGLACETTLTVDTGSLANSRHQKGSEIDCSPAVDLNTDKVLVGHTGSVQEDLATPEWPDLHSALRSSLLELVNMQVEDPGADVVQKAEIKVIEDIIKMIKNVQEPSGTVRAGAASCYEEKEHPFSHIDSKSPDLLIDLLKQEGPQSKTCELSGRKENVSFEANQLDVKSAHAAEKIQSQLLQILHAASANDDPTMFKEVASKISDLLENSLCKDGNQTLPCTEKEKALNIPEDHRLDLCDLKDSISQSKESAQGVLSEDDLSAEINSETDKPSLLGTTQNVLECVGRLQDHSDVLEDIRNDLEMVPVSNTTEALKMQLEETQSLESQLSALAGILTKDLKTAGQLLRSSNEQVPTQIRRDLETVSKDVQHAFSDVCKLSSARRSLIISAIDSEKLQLAASHQELLDTLEKLSISIQEHHEVVSKLDIMNTDDLDTVKYRIQQNKDLEKNLSVTQQQLETTAFDVQFFISENAQDLSPTQSRQLLKSLSATQRLFKDLMEKVSTQRHTLNLHLEIRQDLSNLKSAEDKQKEYADKLQELCDQLTQTENRLIGHQQSAVSGDSLGDLQQYQKEHQALQRDVQAGESALSEVVRSTKTFLDENRDKLQPEKIAVIESKLEEAKSKSKLLNQRAEESRKHLDKAMTTAIKQETEKVVAVEKLEESKNKIEGLLGWLSNIGKETEREENLKDKMAKQNGNLPLEMTTSMIGEEDEANGNLLQENAFTVVDGKQKDAQELDLNRQYDRVKAHHQEILSQQQDVIIATQSAQALLDKQAQMLTPEEKEKLQRNIQELKDRYDATLTEAEQKMKQIQNVQEELHKFESDCGEFETWLQQSEGEMEELKTATSELGTLNGKLQRQRSFSEDVISHKGDLRFITISGQRVLDAAKSCSRTDPSADSELDVDTSGACAAVQHKLDSAAKRYKALHSQCNQLGNNLRDVVEKYKKYEDASSGLLNWLNESEGDVMKQLTEPIAADPKNLQKQLEETKALQGQMSGRQVAVETLRKTADALITAEGDLLTNQDDIQETVDDIVERYENLSKSVSDRNEKLQITLTRSLSVQDGLDEMMGWMEGVEKSLEKEDQMPLNSTAIQDVLSKKAVLDQDISSRQSSISAMKEKVKKFIETADPSMASSLQTKMDTLSNRFTDACEKHKEKVAKLEELKEKVELFEKTYEKVQQFVDKRSQVLSETDGPGRNVNELSQLMQETNTELGEHAKDVELLKNLSKELSEMSPEGSKAQVQDKMEALTKNFKAFKETVKEKEEEVSSCQGQLNEFKSAAECLRKWIEESTEKVPIVQPSCSVDNLEKHQQKVNTLLEEWTSRAPAVQDINNKGSALCSLISVLTSPAKTKTVKSGSAVTNGAGSKTHAYLTNKEMTVIQQNMSYINDGYENLGAILKGRAEELGGLLQNLQETQKDATSVMQWLEDMSKTAASWDAVSTEANTMKEQMEQQKVFEEELKQKQGKLQQLREKLLDLIEKYPDSPEAAKWKQMLDQIDSTWKDINTSVEDRKQKLEESSKHLTQFQTAEAQLKQWLSEKELMMSVLGPLSVDPNMLNTQKQQVQILLNEFDSHKSQYDQLNEAAQGILSAPGELPPSCGVVKEQLAAVAQKWENLTGQLSQRSERIDQAITKTTEFQNLLKDISDKVATLDDTLRGQPSLSAQPDAVKKQLEIASDICSQLREEKQRISEAETLCSDLSALVAEEYLKADLTRQLESVKKPFKELEEKAGNRIQELNSTFASSQHFNQMSKDFQTWLDGKMQEQSKSPAISAKIETLQQNISEHVEFQQALMDQGAAYETLMKEGDSLLQSTHGAEKSALQGQLSALKSNWDEVKKKSADRMDKLQGCLQRAQKYRDHVEKLSPWIEECESKASEVKICINPAEVERSISEVKALQKDADKHRGLVELLNNAADSLLEVAHADEDFVRDEKASINQKLDNVIEKLQQKKDSLDEIAQRLKEFNESQKEAKGQLDVARKQLEVHVSLGAQAYSNKHLANMQDQQKSLAALKPQVDYLKNLAQGLVVDVPDAAGVTDLLLETDSLEKDYNLVSKEVEENCSMVETKLQGIGQFQNSIREMFSQFADFDDELDSMAPVARDLDTLQSQKDDIKGFISKLEELMANTVRDNTSCKKMLESEASPDLLGLKRDLEALNKQCTKLMDRAKGREEQVESTLSRMDELYQKLKQFTDKLGVAQKRHESQGPVGMETEIINQQLEAFKVFQKEDIEPLQAKLQDLNWLGQGLVQSAAKNASTQSLEHDLEDVNTRWNTLNKKVAARTAELHEALLHCGRFQDALESLLSWLTDTEELVANQRPPSAEFKVIKAQIQEQKLLQRLLDEHKPTVELIKNEGGKMSELAEPADKEKIVKEIVSLGQRWDNLLKKAEDRQQQLESILVVAQQFHETLEPLSEWLTATEKRLANSEPIGTQTKKLEQQISQHKALEGDVMGHSKDLHQAVSLGQTLKTLSSLDDKDLVQAKLDSSQSHFTELQESCARKAAMLQQALSNAQHFGEDEVALMNWLNEVHDKLSNVSVQDYSSEVIQKQHIEQLALHEDIVLKKQNVDLAIQNGLELLKQTTGDEVVVVQGKLEGIKAKYAEINSMSNSVSKTLDQALALATKLQTTHEELCSWLDNIEAEVVAFEAQVPVGEQLTHVQDRQKELLKEATGHKGLVDSLNEVSSALLELVPWRAREGLDKLVSDDNKRYKSVSDTIAQHVDQIDAAILKSQQFEDAANAEVTWLTEAEGKLASLGEIRLEQDQTMAQLQAQKAFSMDILRHKDAVDEIVKTGEALMSSRDEEEQQSLQDKIKTLLEKYNVVHVMNSERCLQLERAQSLASQFWETYEELWPWLQETRSVISQLPPPAIDYDTLKQQQEELRQMRELIAEHKPHIDKMNKTGPQLLELSPVEGVSIREKYTATDQLYTQLRADVKERASALDEAISKSTQFHDKIDPMLESLERIVDRLRQPPSISVEVEKIKEQIAENKAVSVDLEKLQPTYETLKQRGEEMIARSEGADNDISAKAVQDKLDQMVFIWEDIQALLEEREAKLLDVMDLAEKFWCDHCALIVTIKDTQDLLRELEEPGVDPSVVKQQQETVESFKEEIDGLQEETDVVHNLGAELMAACGEPDKPVIKKSIDEVNSAWDTLNKTWKERVDRLEEAMQMAVQFQDGLQGLFDWVDIVESKLDSMSPVGTDLETVKQQIEELKEFKGEAYQLQIEMERLNHQAELLLKKVVEECDKCAIQEPVTELKMLWENLDEKIIHRQHKLEGALLALGQFQHALDELLMWFTHTEELLSEQRKAGGDPKAIEIELAKHHVLQNDVLAHKTTVEAVNRAGNDLIESSAGEEASSLQSKLESLNQRWKTILEKTEQRRQHLDSALLQAQGFHGEIEDMQKWLKDTERQLLASKAAGGLPETAREQLNAHLELCSVFEAKEELYNKLIQRGQQLLSIVHEGHDINTEQDLKNLKEKWESVQTKMTERKGKLEEALTLATEFHNSLQDFINWLTQAEQTLTMASPASLILDTIVFQIDEHKVFVTEVNSHREQIIELDKTGTHLKYFSQKQDVVLIKNLLISVQSRWEKVVQRSVERGRILDDARKRAKQFQDAWNKLTEWLEESEKALDSELEIANDPDKIKMQLAQHKEFQKSLGGKHSVYDTTLRTGRSLKEKTCLDDDTHKLDDMLSELRDKWDTVCGKSVERQNKLEEALLFSGQFTDALQALIDWLYKVEPQLAEDQPVHGDIDLVLNLIDNHKGFQKELGKRTGSVQALKRSAKELIESSHDDSSWVKAQMQELSTRWETVCARSVSKQTRLEQSLIQAEEFHSTVHILLEWLAEAEQSLRFHGALPDDEEALRALIDQHKEFMKKLEEKRVALTKATGMGEAILTICHPDSITTIKHWNTIIKARFEEVLAWSKQHQQRLGTALNELLTNQELLENLLGWLQWAETTLKEKDKETLPEELEEVKTLIAEHQTFMEEMTRKQPDVDKVTKTHKRKAVAEPVPPIQSHIPVLDKGRGGRKRFPTQGMYPSGAQTQIETKNPRVNLLVSKWQQVWLLALDRRRKLNDALDRLEELREFANFDFDVWRKRYMRWMNHKKSRVMDFFRRIDKDQDGKITRQEFIDGILSSKFPTSRLEMSAVADIFDRDGDGYIDYYEFVAALHPNKDAYKPLTDADKIEDEVTRQVAKCKCPKRFQVEQIGANKYRFYLGNQFGLVHCLHDPLIADETIANRDNQNVTPQLQVAVLESCILFGDSQQLRLVRILRSTVMVRVGGGWMALDEFLVKNDPCRVHHHGSKMLRSESNSSITTQSPIAKGRTNMELREKFMLPDGATQMMTGFRYRGRRSRPSSRAASPNRSTSSHSHNVPPNPAGTSTPKTPQHLTRNYDKPWLTNSKTSTPIKSADSFESQGSSTETTPIQGSKLRLPGYLSGKGFQSTEEGSLITTAASKARSQAIDLKKTPSRPGSRAGSKAGSRGSSRRGSDASDFDISDIQSVCSDASETVHDPSRPGLRTGPRASSAKPSKIPTPQRRSPAASKLAKTSKR